MNVTASTTTNRNTMAVLAERVKDTEAQQAAHSAVVAFLLDKPLPNSTRVERRASRLVWRIYADHMLAQMRARVI